MSKKKTAERVALERAVEVLGGEHFEFWEGDGPSATTMLKALRAVMETPGSPRLKRHETARHIVMSAYYHLGFSLKRTPLDEIHPRCRAGEAFAEIVLFGQLINRMDEILSWHED